MLVAAVLLAFVGFALTAPTARDISLQDVNYIFSFGDSYTDSGFDPTGAKPSPSCALGNPSCVTGNTLAGGHDWMTALTSVFNKSLTLTYNFAVSGYVIDSDVVPSRPGVRQIEFKNFLETSATKPDYAPWRSDNALFSMFIGINDIGATFNVQDDNSTFFHDDFEAWTAIMNHIYSIGGRKFLFVNVPATWRTPMFADLSASDEQKLINAVTTWNEDLVSRIHNFHNSNEGVEVFFWDAFATFNRILDDPTKYGFVDNTTQCSSPPGDCFWWNNYHPSSSAHLLFAQEVSNLLDGFWIPADAVPHSSLRMPRWLSWLGL